jgi:hypothetical protein
MGDNPLMRAWWLLAFTAISCVAQNSDSPMVNLGRLSIARVSSSGPNSDDKCFGVRNAFDGISDRLEPEDCSYWYSDAPQDFVIVRFSQPVTVAGIVVKSPPSPGEERSTSFQALIRSGASQHLSISSHAAPGALGYTCAPAKPIEGVREVLLMFGSPRAVVDEIEILGPPPAGVDLSPVTPTVDPQLLRSDPDQGPQAEREMAARTQLHRTLARKRIEEMRAARLAVDRAPDAVGKAKAWLALNHAADLLAETLDYDKAAEPLVAETGALGVTVWWCEINNEWAAGTEGYDQYLKLAPNGPQADTAWWMARLDLGPRCSDFGGTRSEIEAVFQLYSEFLERYPGSSHSAIAWQQWRKLQDRLKAPAAE